MLQQIDTKEKSYQEEGQITYTTILHQARRKLGITMTEYSVADTIHKLGGGKGSRKIGGWVYGSKEGIGNNLGISRRTVIRAVNKLEKLGLIERQPKTNYLRSTDKWFREVELEKRKISRT